MDDTIAAIATPYGEGGIGIVRMSGDKAYDILADIFVPINTRNSSIEIPELQNRRLTYGHIIDPQSKKIIDQVLVVFMKASNTYTREDVVEINCHGGMIPLMSTLSLVLEKGARLADKGEFTKRAFLNGRIDLSQAEAVIDVIRAKTSRSFDVAMAQMEGRLSGHVKDIREKLMDLLVNIAVNIDYPDEDIEEVTYFEINKVLKDVKGKLKELLDSSDEGRILREGLNLAIVGKPNVGKSSLMNALLRESRAIVTEIPGTTRDTIEEGLNLRGIPIKLTDTAGIRETDDIIEKIGIERSRDAFNKADLILFVMDVSSPLESEDKQIAEYLTGRNVILLLNKADLRKSLAEEQIRAIIPHGRVIYTSMTEEFGLNELEDEIENMVFSDNIKRNEGEIVSNVRHKDLLKQAFDALEDAEAAIISNEPLDLVELDVRSVWQFLGEIIGETVTEDIINMVFERFCLGK